MRSGATKRSRARAFFAAAAILSSLALFANSAPAWSQQDPAAPGAEITAQELGQAKAAEATRIAAIGRVYGSVVAVYGKDRAGGGSGVVIHPSGLALTNHHVVAAAGVEGWGGLADGKLYRWKLVGTDPGGDVAIIQLLGKTDFPAAPLGDSRKVRVGDWAFAMGNPFTLAEDQRPTVSLGIVSGVDRYQAGAGENTLVYGRCIQVDSSINPGNSGGPLFSGSCQLIGINGRASFEERGRVNIGAGYAISLEQIIKFIPELRTTRLAQHGTLDAVFAESERGVICQTLNLDSRAARQGLALGDRLLEFEGETIRTANQFTNIVSTLPAEWPVKMVIEHEGTRRTIHVRLLALPYAEQPDEPPPAPEKKEEKKDAKKDPSKPGEKPGEGEKPKPPQVAKRPRPNFGKPGEYRDAALNRRQCEQLAAEVRGGLGFDRLDAKTKGFRWTDDVFRGEEKVGRYELVLAADGRFRYEIALDGQVRRGGLGSGGYWISPREDGPPPLSRMLLDPLAAQGAVLASLATKTPFATLGECQLEGSDLAAGRPAYRLKITTADKRELFLWLSVLNEQGQWGVQLLKLGGSRDGQPPLAHVRFDGWSETQPHAPRGRTIISGLEESPLLRLAPVARETIPDPPDALFDAPADAKPAGEK